MRDWGFRLDNFKKASRACLFFGLPALFVLITYGIFYKGYHPLWRSVLVILLIYPVWGLIQQFALQVFVNKNLRELGMGLGIRVPIVALLFGLSHFPNYPLMVLVLILGLATTLIYEKTPNIPALAILHGFLGTLAYFLVLGLDPAAELFHALS